jgi:NAD+-dependent protein deacetylase SIR2
MDAPSCEPSTKRQRVGEVVPASVTETGLERAHPAGGADIKESSDVKSSSSPIYLDQYHVLGAVHIPDLETDIPSKNCQKLCEESEKSVLRPAKAEAQFEHDPGALDPDRRCAGPRAGRAGVSEICTYEQTLRIRYQAREIGLERFFTQTVLQQQVSLERLCAAFNVPPPAVPVDPPDSQLLARLKKAIAVDMRNRIKLQKYNSVDDAITLVRNAKNIMVITGAGISTSLNIPDFRSRGGLYSTLEKMGFKDPEYVFSRDTFEQDPLPFFSVASMILPPTDGRFTPAHAFLRLLQEKGKLLTLYTQNIDGIDLTAGIRREKLVQLHGSFETATCITCGYRVNGEVIFGEIRKGEVPLCAVCAKERQIRNDQMAAIRAQNGRSVRRKIQRSSIASNTEASGIMRPDIVFMGEPPKPYEKRFKRDCALVDLVIVMGTSLPVEPVKTMPNHIPPKVPQIYIGKNQMYPERMKKTDFDIQLLGECDVIVELLAKSCGWDLQHEMLPKGTSIEIEPWCGERHHHLILREKIAMKREVGRASPSDQFNAFEEASPLLLSREASCPV